jgi:hypothetical protein
MNKVRTLNDADKALLALALLNADVKARIRKFPTSLRVVFEGPFEPVQAVLNENGFRFADGGLFTRFSFNQPNEVFVRFMAAN